MRSSTTYVVIVYPDRGAVEVYEVETFRDVIELTFDEAERIIYKFDYISGDKLRVFLFEKSEDVVSAVAELEENITSSALSTVENYIHFDPFMTMEIYPCFEVRAHGRYLKKLYENLKPSYRFAIVWLFVGEVEFVATDTDTLKEQIRRIQIEDLERIRTIDDLISALRDVAAK